MTWHAERVEGRVDGTARERLLMDRTKLEQQVRDLAAQPLRSKTTSAMIGRQEDLMALAKKIKSIDKKLGREIS